MREVTEAALVVLPYRELHNSASLLVALSLDRPVLVPRTPSTQALAAEVGGDWVQLFDGDLTAQALTEALRRTGTHAPDEGPDLSDRDWELIGPRHAECYHAAVAAARNHPPIGRRAVRTTR